MLLKNKVLFLLVFLGGTFASYADLSLEGHYQGKNLYVQNPEDEDGFGFCVTKATVNGDPIIDGLQSSAFEIDFTVFGLQIGDPVFIVLEHGVGCKPKVLNKEVLLPKSTFEIQDIKCTPDGALTWTTSGESGKLPFVVEQYRWNKWVVVGEVDGVGTTSTNAYSFNVTPHSGENKVRVTQTDNDNTGKKRPSDAVTFMNTTLDAIEVSPKIVKSSIKFTSGDKPMETKYEIYDAYGNIVKKGVGSEVDCSNLKKGAYYINFDNKNEKFIKK